MSNEEQRNSEAPADEGAEEEDVSGELDHEELTVRVELLEEELERIRAGYAQARRSQYRRTSIGLLIVGLVAFGGGLLFTDARSVLFTLGSIGVFGALLTYYLTPERFISANISERVYASLAGNEAAFVDDLGLTGERIYVPVERAADGSETVKLFIPQFSDYTLPSGDELDAPFVITDTETERGIALDPTGQSLFTEFERALAGEPATSVSELAEQLADSLVEQFELAEQAVPEVDEAGNVVVIGVSGSTYGPVDRFDHPIASFLGVGLARTLDTPVSVTVEERDDRTDYTVVVRRLEAEGGTEPDQTEGSS